MSRDSLASVGGPNGVRTRVSGVRGQRPRPLDDGTQRTQERDYSRTGTGKKLFSQGGVGPRLTGSVKSRPGVSFPFTGSGEREEPAGYPEGRSRPPRVSGLLHEIQGRVLVLHLWPNVNINVYV